MWLVALHSGKAEIPYLTNAERFSKFWDLRQPVCDTTNKWRQSSPSIGRRTLITLVVNKELGLKRNDVRAEFCGNLQTDSAVISGAGRPTHRNSVNKRYSITYKTKLSAWVRERTIPAERLPLVAKLVTTFADRGCRVASATNPYGRILGSLYRSRYYFFQVSSQLYSRRWVDPFPDPLLLRKSGSAQGFEPGPLDL
jgi:hypothetical protein